jgi:hypothetical protein
MYGIKYESQTNFIRLDTDTEWMFPHLYRPGDIVFITVMDKSRQFFNTELAWRLLTTTPPVVHMFDRYAEIKIDPRWYQMHEEEPNKSTIE